MKLFIGSDHAAFEEKETLKVYLKELFKDESVEIIDKGTFSSERCDYPDFAAAVAKAVSKENEKGILVCGSGIGVSMTANRYQGARAALCRTPNDAVLSRQHNNANILCLGARTNSIDELKEITSSWFDANFEEGRHTGRIEKFNNLGESIS